MFVGFDMMCFRVAPVILAGIAVSLNGCGGGGTTTALPLPSTTPSPSPPSLVLGTCNAENIAAGIEDCDRVDYGSCGGACCVITTSVALSAENVMSTLNRSLADGGPDGQYELQYLFENATGFTQLDGGQYLGQVHHTTSGPAHYTDKVNFLIEPDGENSKIKAFSLSLIGGALGDVGQGYKNIIMALKGANFDGWSDASVMNAGGSCPRPSGQVVSVQSQVAEVVERRRLDDSADVLGTCGLSGASEVPQCQNVDLGSCGNACCSLTVTLKMSAQETVAMLNSSLDNGGPDGQFTKKPMAEGGVGFADLTGGPPAEAAPFGFGSGPIYIGQVQHMTTGGAYHFNDTLNFNIVEDENNDAVINAFSTSLIGGAYSDAGQNYKNLQMALSVFVEDVTIAAGKFETSCPGPSLMI